MIREGMVSATTDKPKGMSDKLAKEPAPDMLMTTGPDNAIRGGTMDRALAKLRKDHGR